MLSYDEMFLLNMNKTEHVQSLQVLALMSLPSRGDSILITETFPQSRKYWGYFLDDTVINDALRRS